LQAQQKVIHQTALKVWIFGFRNIYFLVSRHLETGWHYFSTTLVGLPEKHDHSSPLVGNIAVIHGETKDWMLRSSLPSPVHEGLFSGSDSLQSAAPYTDQRLKSVDTDFLAQEGNLRPPDLILSFRRRPIFIIRSQKNAIIRFIRGYGK
jgi:hypothetical protein